VNQGLGTFHPYESLTSGKNMINARQFLLVKLLLWFAAAALLGWLYRNLQSREAALHNDAIMQQVFAEERRELVAQVLAARVQNEQIGQYTRLSRSLPDGQLEGLPPFTDRDTFARWLRWSEADHHQIPPRLLNLLSQNDRFFSGMPKRYAALLEIWLIGAQGLPKETFERLYQVAEEFWHGKDIANNHYRFLLQRLPQDMYEVFCDQLLWLGNYPPYPDRYWLYIEKDDRAHLLEIPARELDRLNTDIAALRIGIRLVRSDSWQNWEGIRANVESFFIPLSEQVRQVRWVHFLIGLLISLTLFAIYIVINRYEKVHQLQKQLLAATSHELRTPVAVMRQFAEMLQERQNQFEPRIQKYHGYIHREALRMQFLVENLLSTAKFEHLKLELNCRPFDLAIWLNEWTEAADLLDEKTQITCEVPDNIHVHWDPTLMSQVVTNLIDNAQKHAGTNIEITASAKDQEIILRFRDFGTKINWQRLKKIKAFNDITKPDKGLGLGLYLVQQIIKRHRGKLTFSDAEPGLCVTLVIPKDV
jgi:signal transduction histidine kinase